MINFKCDSCGKAFSVSDEMAGRKGKCKGCGKSLLVPGLRAATGNTVQRLRQPARPAESSAAVPGNSQPVVSTPAPAAAVTVQATQAKSVHKKPKKAKLPPRTRRLIADWTKIHEAFQNFPLINIQQAAGNPPELYRFLYNVRGLTRGADGKPVYRNGHVVEIQLTRDYPRQSPKCRMLTPIFHPNIEPAMICVGDHWTAAERLVDLVIRIGEMISYQAYNIKSPLDGEAAMWADQNTKHLPTDPRDMRPPNLD